MSSTHSSARSRASFGEPLTDGPAQARALEAKDRRYGYLGQTVTAREAEVLELVAGGLTNVQIGAKLFISEETVKSHVRHILAKLGARTRAHAVAVGIKSGIVELREVDVPEHRPSKGARAARAQRRETEERIKRLVRAEMEAEAEAARTRGFSFRRLWAKMRGASD